ncbi:MAG: CsgG/HfaB family protein [Spirochaetaceae bacterium]|jgi:hypothetical protein|nr:CsgG/HfaB family protein [Spirochaetaceae bacterium]
MRLKTVCFVLSAMVFLLAAAGVFAEVEIVVQRADSKINAGFRERIYVDGKSQLTLANGESGTIRVPDGDHTIYAELYTLKTAPLSFSARSGTVRFTVTPHSLRNFVIESTGGGTVADAAPARAAASNAASRLDTATAAPAPADGSVEGTLLRAGNTIMEKLTPRSRLAIVYVTAQDAEISEFIAGELEFIMVSKGFTLIDRSELDRIRKEQSFQSSGEVDDSQAVSIGKIAGADVIITGAVTGTGSLRRLRLRALSTQTGQVLTVASERY